MPPSLGFVRAKLQFCPSHRLTLRKAGQNQMSCLRSDCFHNIVATSAINKLMCKHVYAILASSNDLCNKLDRRRPEAASCIADNFHDRCRGRTKTALYMEVDGFSVRFVTSMEIPREQAVQERVDHLRTRNRDLPAYQVCPCKIMLLTQAWHQGTCLEMSTSMSH